MPVTTPFDPKTYQPTSKATALSGFASARNLGLERFTILLDGPTLIEMSRRLHDVPERKEWWRWLVYDACLERYKDLAGVIAALPLYIDD